MSILEIKDLHQSYGPTPVLRAVSLKIEQGEFVGIIGLSGSGKSTLLRCINRLIDASSGAIMVPRSLVGGDSNNGRADVLKLARPELRLLRRKIGMVFSNLISPSVFRSSKTSSPAASDISRRCEAPSVSSRRRSSARL